MSAIKELFGTTTANVDSQKNKNQNISKLFSANLISTNELMDKISKEKKQQPTIKIDEQLKENDDNEESKEDEAESGEIKNPEEEEKEEIKENIQKKKKKKLSDENDNLEGEYIAKLMKNNTDLTETDNTEKEGKESDQEKSEKETESSVSTIDPVTEKTKRIDLKEKELEKAERTLFVGNIPISILKDKKLEKKFKKFFSNFEFLNTNEGDVLEANDTDNATKYKIESFRFRSVALNEPLPRKVAISQLKLDEKRDSVNSYIVYNSPKIIGPLCKYLNGSVFENHHLRVDSVSHPTTHDKKRSVFVGNLDFEEVEESLWKHFGATNHNSKPLNIEYVRIIRDPKTNMGKGFAYVQFKDTNDVSKALLLNGKPISSTVASKPRVLRISRCKNMDKKGKRQQNTNDIANKKLNNQQRSKLGRAKKILGKSDKATAGGITIEGERSVKGKGTPGSILGKRKRKPRSKDGRAAKRSLAYKKKLNSQE
ncbi:rRNA-processing protein NOP12 SCDLUD_000493 [Saccharomycodes ludwigii]|uniref:rRNA-processing protein NOP12 n=1 Tax=Saccharomycodes ludwigii TaxID=36035 RepID=UPI001E87186B|nr:hypothetical protein SCDLUD_000493 [Saccharomycodes ludwigii]KAH3902898.1 hypothetical protein SCDLUD_000493 [Saccharomycodes ludwigii]